MFAYFNLLTNWNNFLRICDNDAGYPKYNKYWIICNIGYKPYYSWDFEKDKKYTRNEMWDRIHELLNNDKDLNEKFLNFILSVPIDVIE